VDAAAVAGADLVTFASSSSVESFLAALPAGEAARLRAVSIGPATSATLRAAGIEPVAEAAAHDVGGLVEAVLAVAGPGPGSGPATAEGTV
jgi:uroporphyrinogen-III synthase